MNFDKSILLLCGILALSGCGPSQPKTGNTVDMLPAAAKTIDQAKQLQQQINSQNQETTRQIEQETHE